MCLRFQPCLRGQFCLFHSHVPSNEHFTDPGEGGRVPQHVLSVVQCSLSGAPDLGTSHAFPGLALTGGDATLISAWPPGRLICLFHTYLPWEERYPASGAS